MNKKILVSPSECITFVDSNFINLDLYFSNNDCNKPVKFLRSNGTVKINNIDKIKEDKKIFQFSKIKLIN